ncbi:hypothetical protein IPM62_01825 [Candidatus Woesebacteria bacterium]|nr:MAG: hypothetical protein IPM62_01825 [Candidatus Woesebacteria bacterium]
MRTIMAVEPEKIFEVVGKNYPNEPGLETPAQVKGPGFCPTGDIHPTDNLIRDMHNQGAKTVTCDPLDDI